MKIPIPVLTALLLTSSYCQETTERLAIDSIPHSLEWVVEPIAFTLEHESIAITAGSQTNMFYSPNGTYRASNVPKLLFQPIGDFRLQAKATADHRSKWDAATLVVYIDEDHWAKLCFEYQDEQTKRIVSVVTNGVSDDAYSDIIDTDSVYLKIEKRDGQTVFSYSKTGREWVDIRYFHLHSNQPEKVGFSSQSPIGDGLTSVFSKIAFEEISQQ